MLIAARNGMLLRSEDLTKYEGAVFIVTMAAGETFSLPMSVRSATTVEWGDGSTTITNGGLSHTYTSEGTYVIKISDTVASYGSYNNIHRTWPMQIIKFGNSPAIIGNYGFRWFDGLTYIGDFAGVTRIGSTFESGAFLNCVALEEIGDAPNVNPLYSAFYGCTKVKNVGRFPLATSITQNCFGGCSGGMFESDLDRFPNVTTIEGNRNFADSGFQELNLPKLTTISGNGIGYELCRGCPYLRSFRAPNLTLMTSRMFWQSPNLSEVKLGLIDTIVNVDVFTGTSASLKVWVKNTMSSLMAFSGIPWQANNGAVFYCIDGYVSRINGTWTDHTWESVNALPNPGDTAYTFTVSGIDYRWNGAEYVPDA